MRANPYSSKNANGNNNETTLHDNNQLNNLTTSTISYEQLSREFYQSYDPSIGLHTAAVLGGILLWLLLYLIYKTKIRKCIVHLIKKMFGEAQEELSVTIKSSDAEKDCSSDNNNSVIRYMGNPSIVIEVSPPQSQLQSPFPHDQYNPDGQDCLSPYSLPTSGHEDGIIFKFPSPDQVGVYQDQCQCHSPCCLDPHDVLLHLPKSEMDIRSATAQWVQNMPLAARSQQDFAGLMQSLTSHGLLAMNKPCSCPLVCPRTPQPLPVLDLPHTWNNSLPVLSNSLSSQILSAYEAVINQAKENDIKNLVNSARTFNSKKDRHDNHKNNVTEYTALLEKNDKENVDPLYRRSCLGSRCDKNKLSKLAQATYNYQKHKARLVKNAALARSPRPIPVTPTVMIQSSNPSHNHYRCRGSNTSMSSSSSADALLAPGQSSFKHAPKSGSSRLPSPHLLSPLCDNRSRRSSKHYSWSNVDLSGSLRPETPRSRSVSSHLCGVNHHTCSFKYQGARSPSDTNPSPVNNSCILARRRSLYGSNNLLTSAGHIHGDSGRLSQQCRSLSDSNCGMNGPKNQLNSCFPMSNHQRSQSADVTFSMNLQRGHGSPTYSNESNRTSIGTSSRSHSPSPYLLQVPDPHNLFRPVTPDAGANKKYHADLSPNGPHPGMRHCVRSDGNIAYHAGYHLPVISHTDNSAPRRHSTFSAGPEEINLSLCCDNTARSSSSIGSSGTQASSHQHSHLPYDDKHHPQTRHQSAGLLRLDNGRRQACGLFSQSSLNRSYSGIMMETKL